MVSGDLGHRGIVVSVGSVANITVVTRGEFTADTDKHITAPDGICGHPCIESGLKSPERPRKGPMDQRDKGAIVSAMQLASLNQLVDAKRSTISCENNRSIPMFIFSIYIYIYTHRLYYGSSPESFASRFEVKTLLRRTNGMSFVRS